MDLNTITSVARPRERGALRQGRPGDAWLAGGTWLMAEPQPHLRRLVDLTALAWPPVRVDDEGLCIAATCTVATLDAVQLPVSWKAAWLVGECCRAFLASFKIWTMATVGGNLCLALPAGPMISLCAALDGSCLIWAPEGGERRLSVLDLITGPQRNALQAGELLRQIDLPAAAFRRRAAFRRISLTPLGRSGALPIGTVAADGAFVLTVTASTRRPVRLAFPVLPTCGDLLDALEAEVPADAYFDDIHGRPDWRRHVTRHLAQEIWSELGLRAP